MAAIITALSTQSDAAFQDDLATIATDQATHAANAAVTPTVV
jgi:hypothetical protein